MIEWLIALTDREGLTRLLSILKFKLRFLSEFQF